MKTATLKDISTNTLAKSEVHDRFPLARVLILILAGAFVGLMVDIRAEHVEAVRQRPIAWLPIIYCAFMTISCLAAFAFWSKTSRIIMIPLFLLAFVVGGMGFYFHNHGDFGQVIKTSVSAWTDPTMKHSDGPPQTAPLAFAGLGVIGILASLKRFNP
jgi:uncharacterized membrane protein